MWRRKRGSFVLNCRFAVFLTTNWLVEFASWREKLNYDHELFGFSYELFSRCSENRNFLSCNSNKNFKFNFILFNFFQSLWLHRAHVEDVPHLYVLFKNFFLLKEALALAYDYITDSDGRCFIRTFVSKNFSEIGKKMNRKRSSIFLVIKQFSSTTHRLYHQFWWQVFQFELFCLKIYQELEKKSSKTLLNLKIKIFFFLDFSTAGVNIYLNLFLQLF